MVVDLVLLQRLANPRTGDGSSPFLPEPSRKTFFSKSDTGREGTSQSVGFRVVQLVRDGVTGMDLLEVFLRRRIQPLQAHDHPMWMYSGLKNSTRIHPEDVSKDTLEKWLMGITSNKDNPRGSRKVIPFDNSH